MNNSCTVLLIMAALTATSVSARPGDRIDRRPIHVCQQCSDLRFAPDLAADADGRFVVVWTKSFVDEIRARRYAADGTPLGNEFLVASGEIASSPAVAMASDGRFVVTWVEGVLDGSGSQIGTHLLARRFGANGAAIPGVLTVSSPAAPAVQDVAMDSAGNFVITWNDLAREIQAYARSYDATGTPRGPELVVANVGTESGEIVPRVAMGNEGQFVVVWQQKLGLDGERSVRGQRYDLLGNAIGTGFFVAAMTDIPFLDEELAVAAAPGGAFTVVYPRYQPNAVGWDFVGAFARRFSAEAVARGPEFRVSAPGFTVDGQVAIDVDVDADGDFVVAWNDWVPISGSNDVHVRLYAESGAALTPDRDFYRQPATIGANVAMDANGNFLVAWVRLPRHGELYPIGPFAQRFAGPEDRRAGCAGFIATKVGTNANDTIHGSASDDVITGLGGNDMLYGGGGADVLCGAGGDDQLFGEAHWDVLSGGPGDDVLHGGDGRDVCAGNGEVNADSAIQCETVSTVP